MSEDLKFHNTNEMKSDVVLYGQLNNEIKNLQERMKELREKKTNLSHKIKNFMKFNDFTICRISPEVNTTIKKISYFEKESKKRITCKMIEDYFSVFFDEIDISLFLNLSNKDKAKAFFEFLESKREKTLLESIIIR